MKAQHFTAVYAARWEVELLFRELKRTYRIKHMPSANNLMLNRHNRAFRQERIERFLTAEAPDPNWARGQLSYRAQQGIYRRA